jgi:predicted N-acetyltransferase YhbS
MVTIRTARIEDATACGRVLFEAFRALADLHHFERDFPSVEVGEAVAGMLLANPTSRGFVAEDHGVIVGCNFVDIGGLVAGIGPFAVDPGAQTRGIGRSLMHAAMEEATASNPAGTRFAQAAYNNTSLCLYTKLGFQAKAPLSVMQGSPIRSTFPGYQVVLATEADLPACNELCRRVHGLDRSRELEAAIAQGSATVVRHLDRVTGYATAVAFFGHAVAADNQSLKALIGAADHFPGLGFIVPTENHDLLFWCLDNGLRLVMQMTLMSSGLYATPTGSWLPSVLY